MSVLTSPTSSSSAMGWTTPSGTGRCPTSEYCGHLFTPAPEKLLTSGVGFVRLNCPGSGRTCPTRPGTGGHSGGGLAYTVYRQMTGGREAPGVVLAPQQ